MQFLVIARIPKEISSDKILPYLKPEAEKVWEYYQTDLLRSIHYIADLSGVVMILEADSLDTVRSAMNKFPMAENDILDLEIVPLKPYTGIKTLFVKT
ncbi:MAG: hypothetical protein ACRC2R_22175 [Xenococcaceae cyanobacterium]